MPSAAAAIDTSVGHIDGKILEASPNACTIPFVVDLQAEDSDRLDGLRPDRAGRPAGRACRESGSPATRLGCCWPGWSADRSCSARSRSISCACRCARSASWRVPPTASARAATSAISGRAGRCEIRQAAHAFNLMRHRILRHISQRTEMLAAVSHDLRTPLTRMRLELELVGPEQDPALSGLRQDVGEMSKLVDEYLGFARGEGRESVEPTELRPILDEHAAARRAQRRDARDRHGPLGRAAAAADRLPSLPGQPGRQCLPLRALDRHLGQAEGGGRRDRGRR